MRKRKGMEPMQTRVTLLARLAAIQSHGGIGMTEEYAVGACVRRLALAASAYGDSHHHLAALADHLLGEPA